jgi:hypothetical protein
MTLNSSPIALEDGAYLYVYTIAFVDGMSYFYLLQLIDLTLDLCMSRGVVISVCNCHPLVGGSLSSMLCWCHLLVSKFQWLGLGWEGSPMDDEQDSSFVVWFPHCHRRCGTWNVGQ